MKEQQDSTRRFSLVDKVIELVKIWKTRKFEVHLIGFAVIIFSFAVPGIFDYLMYAYELCKDVPNPQRPSIEILPVAFSFVLFLIAIVIHVLNTYKNRIVSSDIERATFLDNLAKLSDGELNSRSAELEAEFNRLWRYSASMQDILKFKRHSEPTEGLIRMFKISQTELKPTPKWFTEKGKWLVLRYCVLGFITFLFLPFSVIVTALISISEYTFKGLLEMGSFGFPASLTVLACLLASWWVMVSDIKRKGHARTLLKLNPEER